MVGYPEAGRVDHLVSSTYKPRSVNLHVLIGTTVVHTIGTIALVLPDRVCD